MEVAAIRRRFRYFRRIVLGILAVWQAVFLYVAIAWHDVMTSHLVKFDARYADWLIKQQAIHPSWGRREDLCFIFLCVGMALMMFILALEQNEYQRWLRSKFSLVCGLVSAILYLIIFFCTEYFLPYCRLYRTLLLPEIFSLMILWTLFHVKRQLAGEAGHS
jgi:membrane-associated HD superfamily phosphohydrolase